MNGWNVGYTSALAGSAMVPLTPRWSRRLTVAAFRRHCRIAFARFTIWRRFCFTPFLDRLHEPLHSCVYTTRKLRCSKPTLPDPSLSLREALAIFIVGAYSLHSTGFVL